MSHVLKSLSVTVVTSEAWAKRAEVLSSYLVCLKPFVV